MQKILSRSLALIIVFLAAAAAHAFPDKQITIIMPFAPGSSVDVVARDFALALAGIARQPVIVDNRPGAEGAIAGMALVNAPVDGHTLMFTSSSLPVLDPLLKKKMPYEPVGDFAPVCSVARIANVMNITGSSALKTVADVLAAAKAQPEKLTYAYTSTTTRLAAELFQQATGTRLRGIPYKSSVGALTDVVGGQVDLIFIDPVVVAPFYPTGKLRALAVAGAQRIKALPDVPSAVEAGVPGYNVSAWFGLFAPGKTPPATLSSVREMVARALKTPGSAADLEKRGLDPMVVCGDAMEKMRGQDFEFWRDVVKKSGIQPE
jgi:tripartite-type tricarboxylate transporter receptor subunit TctC